MNAKKKSLVLVVYYFEFTLGLASYNVGLYQTIKLGFCWQSASAGLGLQPMMHWMSVLGLQKGCWGGGVLKATSHAKGICSYFCSKYLRRVKLTQGVSFP
jgi:hypothetical protein